jgi:hypothetical protein
MDIWRCEPIKGWITKNWFMQANILADRIGVFRHRIHQRGRQPRGLFCSRNGSIIRLCHARRLAFSKPYQTLRHNLYFDAASAHQQGPKHYPNGYSKQKRLQWLPT